MSQPEPITATVKQLGYAGLSPFIALTIATYVFPKDQQILYEILANYAFAIICFLVGSWWGLSLIRKNISGLILSNVIVLITVAGMINLSQQHLLIFEMIILQSLWLMEFTLPLFENQPDYYKTLRLILSLVAGACLIIAAAA